MGKSRAEWLAERRTGIGGSDVAGILGVSPWLTPLDVWMDKTGRAKPAEETEAMRVGIYLERFVADRYCEATGRRVQRFNRMLRKGCLLANFDRLVVPEGAKVAAHRGDIRTDLLLECKTSGHGWGGEVPVYYQAQVQHYMGMAEGLRHADVATLFLAPVRRFDVFRVERDQDAIDMMAAACREFWERHVVADVPPRPVNERDCRALWARSNPGKTVYATADIEEQVGRIRAIKHGIEVQEEELAKLTDEVKCYMGDSEVLSPAAGGWPLVTWRSGRDRAVTDWRGVALELGPPDELIGRHTAVRPGNRAFLVKDNGKGEWDER